MSTEVRPSKQEVSPVERLRRIVSFLEEQANESPFTREEWERVDKQIAEQNREIERLRAALLEYGQHVHGCDYEQCLGPCTCGFADARDEAAPPAETKAEQP
jgi:hypothetical protein